MKPPFLIVGEFERQTSGGRSRGMIVAFHAHEKTRSLSSGPKIEIHHVQKGKSLQHHQNGACISATGRRAIARAPTDPFLKVA
jgi:hypothetical protein